MSKEYTVNSAVAKIEKSGGQVSIAGKKIIVPVYGVGIGTWGAIDYLHNKHGFVVRRAK